MSKLKHGEIKPRIGLHLLKSSVFASKYVVLFLQVGLCSGLLIYAVMLGYKLCQSDHILHRYQHGPSLVGRPQCRREQFALPGMDRCRPWLTCDDLKADEFSIGEWIGRGYVKNVYAARWQEHKIAVATLIWWKFGQYRGKYRASINLYSQLGPSPYITQYLGTCGDWHLTEYHPFGSSHGINKVLAWWRFSPKRELAIRFNLCIQYAKILKYLHRSPIGTIVMCDSKKLKKTLSQFLVTSDFNLVLNDIEDIKVANRSAGIKIKCSKHKMKGHFAAPEQMWPYKNRTFHNAEMPAYDEKSDIYKIPPVCNFYLGNFTGSEVFRDVLPKIHRRCRARNPAERPTAEDVLREYSKIWKLHRLKDFMYQY